MKEIKIIFITLEIACLLNIAICLFLIDLTEDAIIVKLIIMLLAIFAVVFQREQGKIKW